MRHASDDEADPQVGEGIKGVEVVQVRCGSWAQCWLVMGRLVGVAVVAWAGGALTICHPWRAVLLHLGSATYSARCDSHRRLLPAAAAGLLPAAPPRQRTAALPRGRHAPAGRRWRAGARCSCGGGGRRAFCPLPSHPPAPAGAPAAAPWVGLSGRWLRPASYAAECRLAGVGPHAAPALGRQQWLLWQPHPSGMAHSLQSCLVRAVPRQAPLSLFCPCMSCISILL